MLKMMLEYKGYTTVVTERAEEAMEVLNDDNIRLIIMDMLLSGVNGTDICTTLKNDPERKGIPVIMISAHPNAREICMNAGADDFIAKPFDMRDMLTRIGNFVKQE
jgi:DNA-binding response OmpR family regulator